MATSNNSKKRETQPRPPPGRGRPGVLPPFGPLGPAGGRGCGPSVLRRTSALAGAYGGRGFGACCGRWESESDICYGACFLALRRHRPLLREARNIRKNIAILAEHEP